MPDCFEIPSSVINLNKKRTELQQQRTKPAFAPSLSNFHCDARDNIKEQGETKTKQGGAPLFHLINS